MADALPTKNEIPSFDTYPAQPGSEDSSASQSSRTYMPGTSGSSGAVPGYNYLPPAERSALEQGAARVGGAVGRAVATVRRGRGKLLVMKSRAQQSGASLNNLSDNAFNKANELKSSAQELTNRAQQRAAEFAQDAQQRASQLAQNAQERLSDFADDVRERTADWTQAARERTAAARERTLESYYGVRLRTQAYINENPLQALAIIGGTAVALGATIRVVRSRNAQRL